MTATAPGSLDHADLTFLALRSGEGDAAATASFVHRTQRDVWRYCAHVLGTDAADDAAQATFLRALPALRNYRGESSAKTWLIGVARHVCLDELRARGRRDRLLTKLVAQPVDAPPGLEGQPAELVEAITSLSDDRREAFVLTQVLGFSYEEAAAAAGCPIGTIRSRVARARGDLLDHLAADLEPVEPVVAAVP